MRPQIGRILCPMKARGFPRDMEAGDEQHLCSIQCFFELTPRAFACCQPIESRKNAQPNAARSVFLVCRDRADYGGATSLPSAGDQLDAARLGPLPQRSHVAPSPNSRSLAKRPDVELTPCLV